jgi:UDP-N-acetylmuramoyl-L-alanyl-D-glutamate--2,6-diaminopimelate ligase
MDIETIIKDNGFITSALLVNGGAADVCGISNDSRNIKRGYMFAARKGSAIDSNIYAEEAISKGASAILTDDAETAESLKDKNISVITASDALKAYALICRNFFNNPADRLKIIGVTGTNGKTTTTFLIKSILTAAGSKSGLIGTIDYEIGGCASKSKNTTPDACELNRMFAETVEYGGDYCVMEVSSHSLSQDRVYGVPFDAAVFTNLTRDHLDYHKNMDNYYEAKKKLFSEILLESSKSKKIAVINNDDPFGKKLIGELKEEFKKKCGTALLLLTYGLSEDCDVSAQNVNYYRDGLKLDIVLPDGVIMKGIRSSLIGSYNVYNILAAVSAAYALSVENDNIMKGIELPEGVPGRVQRIAVGKEEAPLICIDYAHTDDALRRVLSALKDLCAGESRLVCVFGCGGDRDKGKRPLMGMHSTDIADISIITSDNPRNEDPASIIKEIESGVKNAAFTDSAGLKNKNTDGRHVYTVEKDRVKAIRLALSAASEKDVVLIAGKGHEDYMIVGESRYHFSDKEEVLKYYKL